MTRSIIGRAFPERQFDELLHARAVRANMKRYNARRFAHAMRMRELQTSELSDFEEDYDAADELAHQKDAANYRGTYGADTIHGGLQ